MKTSLITSIKQIHNKMLHTLFGANIRLTRETSGRTKSGWIPAFAGMTNAFAGMMLISLVLNGCSGANAADQKAEPPKEDKSIPVRVREIKPASFTESGIYYGNVQGIAEAVLVSHAGGQVRKLEAEAGQHVKKGQSLCSIEGERFSTLLESARLSVKMAEDELKRFQEHLDKGTRSQLQVDQAHQAALMARQALLESEKVSEGALCTSPISGTVTHVYIEKNQTPPPGSPTVAVADLRRIKIKLAVPETEIQGFRKGGKAVLPLPDTSEKLEGRISSVSQQVIMHNRSFEVEAVFDNRGTAFKPGQTAAVTLFKAPLQNAVVIPTSAILSLEKENVVMIVKADTARKVPITRGPVGSSETVIQEGLALGSLLITEGQALVSDGSPVRIMGRN